VVGSAVAAEQPPTTARVARAMSWRMANVVVGQGLWYASFFVLAILVAPSDFGVVAVAAVIVNLTILFMSSGVGGSLIIARTLDARSVRREVIRTSATGIVLTLLFVALATPIAHKFAKGSDPNALRALAPIIALIAVAIVPTALLTKNMQFKRIALITISASFVGAVAGVIAAALGAGVWALVIRLGLYQVLVCVLTWVAAVELFPRGDSRGAPSGAREGARAFLAIALAAFVAWEGDTMVVAGSTNTTQVGFYALAFSLAYAPLSQVSWTVGSVLLPAVASTQEREAVRQQALKASRLMALLLLPLLPASIALAPGLIPTLLGEKWSAAVVPFQILIVVGVGQGILNMLGEVFAGAGGASLYRRAYTDVVWAVATLAAIAVGVQLAGIRGAAAAHLITFSCLAAAYVWWVCRTIGIAPGQIGAELRQIALCVLVQAAVTAAFVGVLRSVGASALAAGLIGAAAGLLALALMLRAFAPGVVREARSALGAAIGRRPDPAGAPA